MERDEKIEQLKEEIRARLQRYSQRSGFRFNPDSQVVEDILSGLAARQSSKGKAYCPCRTTSGDVKADAKMVCPCFWHRDEIERDGMCHCKLFTTPEMPNGIE